VEITDGSVLQQPMAEKVLPSPSDVHKCTRCGVNGGHAHGCPFWQATAPGFKGSAWAEQSPRSFAEAEAFTEVQLTELRNAQADKMHKSTAATVQQPDPKPGTGPSMHDLVCADMQERKAFGLRKYGTILQMGNGRNHLVDGLQEVYDLAVYLKQATLEREEHLACISDLEAKLEVARAELKEARELIAAVDRRRLSMASSSAVSAASMRALAYPSTVRAQLVALGWTPPVPK
jgi:hypothetical protein